MSAASIAAKVTRDRIISDWEWEAPALALSKDFGSGYPSDPKYVAQPIVSAIGCMLMH